VHKQADSCTQAWRRRMIKLVKKPEKEKTVGDKKRHAGCNRNAALFFRREDCGDSACFKGDRFLILLRGG